MTQALGMSSAAFTGALVGSQIGNGGKEAGTWASALTGDAGFASPVLILNMVSSKVF